MNTLLPSRCPGEASHRHGHKCPTCGWRMDPKPCNAGVCPDCRPETNDG